MAAEPAEFELTLTKPLGIAFEERIEGKSFGVKVGEVLSEGSAAASTYVWPGDVLTQCDGVDLSRCSFDEVMGALVAAPTEVTIGFARYGRMGCVRFPNGERAFAAPGDALRTMSLAAGFEGDVEYKCSKGTCGSCEWVLRMGQDEDDRIKPVRMCVSKLPKVPPFAGAMEILPRDSPAAQRHFEKLQRAASET